MIVIESAHAGEGEVGTEGEREWCLDFCQRLANYIGDAKVIPSYFLSRQPDPIVKIKQDLYLCIHYDTANAGGFFGAIPLDAKRDFQRQPT